MKTKTKIKTELLKNFPFTGYDIKIDIYSLIYSTTVDFIRFIWWYPFKAWQHFDIIRNILWP